jgi:hypothetical protein
MLAGLGGYNNNLVVGILAMFLSPTRKAGLALSILRDISRIDESR